MRQKSRKRLGWKFPVVQKVNPKCINCGERGAHFVPPSFGDEGFFTCGDMRARTSPIKSSRYRNVGPQDHPDKGQMNGHCNRQACQEPRAVFYNTGTDSYYCPHCAHLINEGCRGTDLGDLCVPPGHKDYVVEVLETSVCETKESE